MMVKVKISKATPKPFNSSEGGMIDWAWYRGERLVDGVTIEFGSRKKYSVGETVSLDLEKTELTNGKFRYKELVPKEVLE